MYQVNRLDFKLSHENVDDFYQDILQVMKLWIYFYGIGSKITTILTDTILNVKHIDNAIQAHFWLLWTLV